MNKPPMLPINIFSSAHARATVETHAGLSELLQIDFQDGCVTYAVPTARGLFGLGSRLLAIPSLTVDLESVGSCLIHAIVRNTAAEREMQLLVRREEQDNCREPAICTSDGPRQGVN